MFRCASFTSSHRHIQSSQSVLPPFAAPSTITPRHRFLSLVLLDHPLRRRKTRNIEPLGTGPRSSSTKITHQKRRETASSTSQAWSSVRRCVLGLTRHTEPKTWEQTPGGGVASLVRTLAQSCVTAIVGAGAFRAVMRMKGQKICSNAEMAYFLSRNVRSRTRLFSSHGGHPTTLSTWPWPFHNQGSRQCLL